MKTHTFRLTPGKDLRQGIDTFVMLNKIQAGCLVTCVGNLSRAVLRMSDGKTIQTFDKSLEIVSLVGTLEAGNSHLHIALSDEEGNVVGGHLKEGSIVGVTAEIVIGELKNTLFRRELDPDTGYEELMVESLV